MANQPQYLYVSQTDLEEVMSVDGVTGAADDDADGSIYPSNAANTTGEQRFILRACIWGTNRVNLYCAARYKQSVLATSFIANDWALSAAAYWMSCRRGNPPPGSYDAIYKETLADLKNVQSGLFQIPEIGTRLAQWPVWSAMRVDYLYPLHRNRVERRLSEGSPVPYPRPLDWGAEYICDR